VLSRDAARSVGATARRSSTHLRQKAVTKRRTAGAKYKAGCLSVTLDKFAASPTALRGQSATQPFLVAAAALTYAASTVAR